VNKDSKNKDNKEKKDKKYKLKKKISKIYEGLKIGKDSGSNSTSNNNSSNNSNNNSNNSSSSSLHLTVNASNYNRPDTYLHPNFTSDNSSMKIPEIIVSPPSPSPFPQVTTSQDHLFNCNGSCGFSQHFSPTTGINNVPILDLEDMPAVCEHEYEDIDVLILESVFNTRNDCIRPIDSVYMNRVNETMKKEDLLDDEGAVTEIRTRDIPLDGVLTDDNNNPINFSNNVTSNKASSIKSNGSNSNKQNYKLFFTKNRQNTPEDESTQNEPDMEYDRCCWITSTLQVLCNLPGVETDFPRYNCMLNDAQRELYKLLQIIQSDDNTLNEIIKLNENDPKLLAFLNNNGNNQRTVNPASMIRTLFSSIQDPFIDYFSGIMQDTPKTSNGLLIADNMTRCNYSSEFTRVLLDKILVGTRLRSRCQATIICRDMCSICHKKSQKSVMKYCRFFPLLLSKEIKAKNKYEISFIDIMRDELNHLPVFPENQTTNGSNDSLNVESLPNNSAMDIDRIPSITLNNNSKFNDNKYIYICDLFFFFFFFFF